MLLFISQLVRIMPSTMVNCGSIFQKTRCECKWKEGARKIK